MYWKTTTDMLNRNGNYAITPSSLASYKSRLVLPLWYRLTCVVLEKRPLNGCSSVAVVVLFFSRARSKGWPHHGRTFSIYLCPLSFWLTLPRRVLSTSWCCTTGPCVVFLACVHLALFLALSLSPGNSLVSPWCDHSMLWCGRLSWLIGFRAHVKIASLSLVS